MINRRQFLGATLAAGAAVTGVGLLLGNQQASGSQLLTLAVTPTPSPPLKKFVDALPIPSVLQPTSIVGGVPQYTVQMTQFYQQLHSQLPPTKVWGYNGTYPGPTIEAHTNDTVMVTWINQLPTSHFLPIDHTLHGAQRTVPDVRNVVHLHGTHSDPVSSGFPDNWYTPGHQATFTYANTQEATTLWYHDHAVGIGRLNIYAGLSGFYLLRDDIDSQLNLPKGAYEIPLMIQDRSFGSDGQLTYPTHGDTHPVWVSEYFADTAVVNGKVWPYLSVEPRKYRFRILNASNSRFYNLYFDSGPTFFQIGTDGGRLEKPVPVTQLLLAPAERADVIVDFADFKGRTLVLHNNAPSPFPAGGANRPLPDIMQFRVDLPLSGKDTSSVPESQPTMPSPKNAVLTRYLGLEEIDKNGKPLILLLNNLHWSDPVTEKPKLGTTEIWSITNNTTDAHPIHLHLVEFRILSRRTHAVRPNEMGPKDTVITYPGDTTRIIANFSGFTGTYVWHCHLLEHEDNEMMRPFTVVP